MYSLFRRYFSWALSSCFHLGPLYALFCWGRPRCSITSSAILNHRHLCVCVGKTCFCNVLYLGFCIVPIQTMLRQCFPLYMILCYVSNAWEIRRELILVFIKVTSISHFFICKIWNGNKLTHVDIKQVETGMIWKLRSSFAKNFHYFQAVIETAFIRRWICSCTGPYHIWGPETCDEMQVPTRYEDSTKSLNIITVMIIWNSKGFVFHSFPCWKCWQNKCNTPLGVIGHPS
jgi:hypothetical protein